MIRNSIVSQLFCMQDLKYRDFHAKLVPNLNKDLIIGVRTPELRKYSKELSNSDSIEIFLTDLPHKYYEENNIHGFIIQGIKDFDKCVTLLEVFLPYIDNWATCDMLRPLCFKNNTDRLFSHILKWMEDSHPYVVRFSIGMLNSYYMDKAFDESHLKLVSNVKSDDYYVRMMIAWYFATALTKQYDTAKKYLEYKTLDSWTHNKAIQKAVESFRISDERKAYLKTLKV